MSYNTLSSIPCVMGSLSPRQKTVRTYTFRLLQHINVNNILVEEQFRFGAAPSTDKASYRLINEILNAMNERKVVGGIFCDLQKAQIVLTITTY
jgi:hypothetical protein